MANRVTASNAGFSLTELMVVLALVGVLSNIAVGKFAVYIAKARRTEATRILHQFSQPIRDYTLDAWANWQYGVFPAPDKNALYLSSLIDSDFGPNASESGCNSPNPFGIAMDCRRSRYRFWVHKSFFQYAFCAEAVIPIFPGCTWKDFFCLNQNNEVVWYTDSIKICSKL